jgi:hypothetical protein
MSKLKYVILTVIALAIISGAVYFGTRTEPQLKPVIGTLLQDPVPGTYSCAQCVNNRDCAQATCNLSCEYFPNGCQTIVSGFRKGEMNLTEKPTVEPLFSGVFGSGAAMELRTVRKDLAEKGIAVKDFLTHINGEYVGASLQRLAEQSWQLDKGSKLTFTKADGKQLEITL